MEPLKVLATFPVLPEAKAWLREVGPGLDELLSDFIYNRARDRARQRVRAALTGEELEDPPLLSEVEAEMELLSHPLARLLVSAVDESLLVNRYAVAESKRLSHHLEKSGGVTVEAVANAVDVPHQRRDGEDGARQYGLTLVDYLMSAPNEKAWHIVRRDPEKGVVWLDKEDFARLLEQVYKGRLETELTGRAKNVPAAVHEVFAGEIERLKAATVELASRFKQAAITAVVPDAFPPCMRRIRQDMHDHVNIPHMGRFAIVTFLHTLGQDSEAILQFFSSVPDFDPEKSRYQIEHITGKGGPTEYTPPGCAAMQSYGVCPLDERDETCAKIKHPLSHYRRSLWAYDRKMAREAAEKRQAEQAATPKEVAQ